MTVNVTCKDQISARSFVLQQQSRGSYYSPLRRHGPAILLALAVSVVLTAKHSEDFRILC